MKEKFDVNDEFRLTADHTFGRCFPMGGYNKDGSVGKFDQQQRRAGSVGRVSEIHESPVDREELGITWTSVNSRSLCRSRNCYS